MNFNEKLIELRKTKGLSQESLGLEINVTRQTISKWELGETTPEMNKLIELSEFFKISVDELLGNMNKQNDYKKNNRFVYEYVSKTKIKGVPLVHINLGHGLRKAKGIIAIGNIAKGIIALGGISTGIIAIGGISLGIFTIAGLAIGLLLSLGAISIGTIAIGGLAIGILAIGGVAVGIYSLGGVAIASNIAEGGIARGYIAIGDNTYGNVTFDINNITNTTKMEIENAISTKFPNTFKWIIEIFKIIK